MRSKSVTSKQREIYDYIVRSTSERGYPPSVREIGQAVGLQSPSTVHAHLKKLEARGLIQIDAHKTRAITFTRSEGVPILGKVTAGVPILAFEQDCGVLPYRPRSGGNYFALRVQGDSMIDAGILDGDFVVARQQDTAEHGEIVVAILPDPATGEDSATVKRLRRDGSGSLWLMPENSRYSPLPGDECRVVGKVTAVVRHL